MRSHRTVLASAVVALLLYTVGVATAQQASPGASSAAAPGAVVTERNVPYGEAGREQLLLDIHRPPTRDTTRPAVLLFHGGGLVFGDRTWMDDWAQHLAEVGYVAFSIGYRLLGEDGSDRWPAQLDDAQRAVRWVRANADDYGVDPERICAFGHSAGGLLASHLGVRDTRDNADPALGAYSSRVECTVDIAGPVEPTIPPFDPSDTSLVGLLGGTAKEVPDAYRDFSPISYIDGDTVPFLVLHSASDTLVSVEHSRRLVDALHAAAIEVVYGEFPNIDHLDWAWANAGTWILAFLGAHLHPDD
jgi:acetyl esterase/lipase